MSRALPETMESFSTLPPDTLAAISNELRPDERVTWVGHPIAGLYLRRYVPPYLFTIVWLGFAIYIMAGMSTTASRRGERAVIPSLMVAWASTLLAVGMPGVPLLAWRKAKRTCYALTNQRAIIFDPHWFSGAKVHAFEPAELSELRGNVRFANGRGDLVFDQVEHVQNDDHTVILDRGFLSIENVKHVEEAVREMMAANAAAPH